MSFGKLYKLETLGFTESTISGLIHFFEKFGKNSIINYDDILQSNRQKNKIGELIAFLLEKEFIEDISEDIDEFEKKEYRILLSREKTAKEKRAERYLSDNDLYNQTKELIIKKLDVMVENEKDGWILFIDFANSFKEFSQQNIRLKEEIISETIDGLLRGLIDKYTLAYKGFELSNSNRGDEIEFYFFDKTSCDKFIKEFLRLYQKDIYSKVQNFNSTRNIKNKLADSLYIKIYTAHSKTPDYSEKNNQMPSFKTMSAINIIKKIEKKIKEDIFLKRMNLSDIDMYFYVSDQKEDGMSQVDIDIESMGIQTMYYQIA